MGFFPLFLGCSWLFAGEDDLIKTVLKQINIYYVERMGIIPLRSELKGGELEPGRQIRKPSGTEKQSGELLANSVLYLVNENQNKRKVFDFYSKELKEFSNLEGTT